jgi:hypothetical protein
LTSRNPLDLTRLVGLRSTGPCSMAQRLAALKPVVRGQLVLRVPRAGVAVGRGGRVLAEETRP